MEAHIEQAFEHFKEVAIQNNTQRDPMKNLILQVENKLGITDSNLPYTPTDYFDLFNKGSSRYTLTQHLDIKNWRRFRNCWFLNNLSSLHYDSLNWLLAYLYRNFKGETNNFKTWILDFSPKSTNEEESIESWPTKCNTDSSDLVQIRLHGHPINL